MTQKAAPKSASRNKLVDDPATRNASLDLEKYNDLVVHIAEEKIAQTMPSPETASHPEQAPRTEAWQNGAQTTLRIFKDTLADTIETVRKGSIDNELKRFQE